MRLFRKDTRSRHTTVRGWFLVLATCLCGCPSLPKSGDFTEIGLTLENENLKLRQKVTDIQRLTKEIEDNSGVATGFGVLTKSENDKRKARIAEIFDQIVAELDEQKRTTIPNVNRLLREARQAMREVGLLRQSADNTEVASLGGPGQGPALGLRLTADDRTRLDGTIASVLRLVDTSEQKLTRMTTSLDKVIAPNLDRLRQSIERLRPAAVDVSDALGPTLSEADLREIESNARAIALFDREALKALNDAFTDHVLLDVGVELRKIAAAIDSLTEVLPPDVVVMRGQDGEKASFRIATDVTLTPFTLGRLAENDVIVLALPTGMALTKPVEILPAGGLKVRVRGNEAGSREIVLVVEHTTGADELRLRTDQGIVASPNAPACGELRLCRTRGLQPDTIVSVFSLP